MAKEPKKSTLRVRVTERDKERVNTLAEKMGDLDLQDMARIALREGLTVLEAKQ